MAGSFPACPDGKNSQPRRRSPPSTANSTSRRSTIVLLPGDGLARSMRLGVEPLDYVVNRILIEALIEAARNVTDVRSRQQVRLVAERVIQRQRLLIEDVNGRARDL